MEVWELELYFYPSAGALKKKKKCYRVESIVLTHMTVILPDLL